MVIQINRTLSYWAFISSIITFGFPDIALSSESCKIRFSSGHSSMKNKTDVITDLRNAKKDGMVCVGLGCQMQQVDWDNTVLDELTPLQVGKNGNWNTLLTPLDNGGYSIEPRHLYPDLVKNVNTQSAEFKKEKNAAIDHFKKYMSHKLKEIAATEGKTYEKKVDELAHITAVNQVVLFSKFGKEQSKTARKEMLSAGYSRLIEATWGSIAKRSESMLKGNCKEVEVQMTCPSPDRKQDAFDERYKFSKLIDLTKIDERFKHLQYQPGKALQIINKKLGSSISFQCGKKITLNQNDIQSMKNADSRFFSAQALMDSWKKKDAAFETFPVPSPIPSPTVAPLPSPDCTTVFQKYFKRSSKNQEKLKKFMALQSQLTLNKMGWAYAFNKKQDPSKNFEATIKQLLEELQKPSLKEMIEEFEDTPFTMNEFRKVAPIVFKTLNQQQDLKEKKKIFLLNLTDLKMIDILIERERQLSKNDLYDLAAMVESTIDNNPDSHNEDDEALNSRIQNIYAQITKISDEISSTIGKIAKKCKVSIDGKDVCIDAKDYAKSLFDPSSLQDALFHTVMINLEKTN